MLNEAKTSRPRPGLWGWGQGRGQKLLWKKYQIMINNIWFKIIAGKINKIPEFYSIFARKMPDYIIRQRPKPRGRGRVQNFVLEATLASRT